MLLFDGDRVYFNGDEPVGTTQSGQVERGLTFRYLLNMCCPRSTPLRRLSEPNAVDRATDNICFWKPKPFYRWDSTPKPVKKQN